MRVHPLLRLVATEPHVLAGHAAAYAALIQAEVSRASGLWTRRLALYLAALALAVVGLILAGVAAMLHAALPDAGRHADWAMLLVPGVPLALAAILALVARSISIEGAFVTVRRQLDADGAMLREACGP